MNKLIDKMFENGVFEQRYKGIIEIYPRRAMNTFVLEAALNELSKTHKIIKMFPDWLRAFELK